MLILPVLQEHQHSVSYRRAADFFVVEDETQLSLITQALSLKPETNFTFLRNLHLPAGLQIYHCQQTQNITGRALALYVHHVFELALFTCQPLPNSEHLSSLMKKRTLIPA